MQTANYRLSVFYGEPPYPIREDSLFNTKHITPERNIAVIRSKLGRAAVPYS